MSKLVLTISKIRARAIDVPLRRVMRTAMGTIPSAPLVLVDVETREGITGHSYLFTYTPLALKPVVSLLESIGAELAGQPVAPLERMQAFDRRFRLLGWQGLVGMAVSGLDMAFWDALGQAAEAPVARLLGAEPRPLQAYESFGIIDLKADRSDLLAAVDQGFRAIKVKLGEGDLARDVATISGLRDLIGGDVTLMIDYNQSLDPAVACRRLERLAAYDILWAEEPVRAEDLAGHAAVRKGQPIRIQIGENWWFPRAASDAIAAGASDFAMLDVMKIGGVTGWMRAAALAEAASLPVSSHAFVEASAHLLAATPTAHFLEHLDKASVILREPCLPQHGMVTAKGPGLGLQWDEEAVSRFAA
ncbi:mandelate racemase [Rhizobiales bacterium GAS191]|jgi:mandelate racemase|nr:mandelate racemase [Rhizobiales bacterium GAS113]SED32801.1 mandelate racemase [Rhizobiales bacterium GAS188]SEE96409.1 mandelate racemase [Rhizobiales bacterium GAS191]